MRISALFAAAVICAPVEADEIWVSNEKDDTLSSTLYKKMLMSMSRKSRLWRFLPELAQEVK